MQMTAVQRQLSLLRGESADDADAEAVSFEAFADSRELHEALLRQARVATRHKTCIRRRMLFKQVVSRKQSDMRQVLAEITARKRELMQLEADADALEGIETGEEGAAAREGDRSGGSVGGGGEARRKAVDLVQKELVNMPGKALASLCKRFGARFPETEEGKPGVYRVLSERMVAQDARRMRDAAKELRKVIGIPPGGRPQNCDEFTLEDVGDGEDMHPSMQAAHAHKGLRARYLELHSDMRRARREELHLQHQESGLRLEYITFHQSLRSREAMGQRRTQRLAMESDKRRALREMLESAREAVTERLQHLLALKEEAAKEAQAVKEIEIEVTRFSGSLEYRGSTLRLQLQNVARDIISIRKELSEYPGVELRGVEQAVHTVGRVLRVLQSDVHGIIHHSQAFLLYVKNGGDGDVSKSPPPDAPVVDKSTATELQGIAQRLAVEYGTLNNKLLDPLNNVRKVSIFQQALHRLQHGFTYNDYHNFCTRIAAKASTSTPLSRTPSIPDAFQSRSILDSYTCSAARLPKAAPSVAVAKAAKRRAEGEEFGGNQYEK